MGLRQIYANMAKGDQLKAILLIFFVFKKLAKYMYIIVPIHTNESWDYPRHIPTLTNFKLASQTVIMLTE